jgi:hypothetical protein
LLDNVEPQFTSNTPSKLNIKLDQSTKIEVEMTDANHPAGSASLPDLELQASIQNSAKVEQLVTTKLIVTKDLVRGKITSI